MLFDHYFHSVLPNPANVPAGDEASEKLGKRVAELVQSKPEAAAVLRRFGGIHDNRDLIDDLLFATWVLKDIEHRAVRQSLRQSQYHLHLAAGTTTD